jgi:DNA polymerase I-like protein with 3'-5' exonuclease and polymerase domains
MKQAEALVWTDVLPYFWTRGQWVEPLLQVHDCLKMECEEGLEQELHALMAGAMTHVPHTFSVPLEVEGEYGPTFADMKGF